MAAPDAPARTVFVSRFNRVVAIVMWVLDAFVVGVTIAQGGPDQAPAVIPAAFFALFGIVVLWRPRVVVTDEGVELRNVLRSVRVPWAALIHVETRYALTLVTPGAKYAAWAAPAPGRAGAAMARRAERHGTVEASPVVDGKSRPGDLMGSESGEAAYLVRDRWAELRDAGRIAPGAADETPVVVRWHWATDVALLALAALSLVVLGRI